MYCVSCEFRSFAFQLWHKWYLTIARNLMTTTLSWSLINTKKDAFRVYVLMTTLTTPSTQNGQIPLGLQSCFSNQWEIKSMACLHYCRHIWSEIFSVSPIFTLKPWVRVCTRRAILRINRMWISFPRVTFISSVSTVENANKLSAKPLQLLHMLQQMKYTYQEARNDIHARHQQFDCSRGFTEVLYAWAFKIRWSFAKRPPV